MVCVCKLYASAFDMKFNADKSKCMVVVPSRAWLSVYFELQL